MAVTTITYDDKVYINQNSNIPDINKVNDTDMNEIKQVVNNNAEELINSGIFSTNEINTGMTWINGKTIYRKVIDFGYLPNNTYREVASGLSNVSICHMYGFATNSSNATITMPEASGGNTIRIVFTAENKVQIGTTYDRTSFYGYVILEYTKNS